MFILSLLLILNISATQPDITQNMQNAADKLAESIKEIENVKQKWAQAIADEFKTDVPVLIDANGKLLPKPAKKDVTRKCCANVDVPNCGSGIITITPSMIGRTGYNITRSGHYCLGFTTDFNPSTTGLSAIVVNADNVVIDLNGQTLGQSGSLAPTYGILVNGSSNVTIKNGTITGFALNGIRLNSGSSEIVIDTVTALNNGNVNGGFTTGGIAIAFSQDIRILNSRLNENFGSGVAVGGTTKIFVDLCNFDDNVGADNGLFPGTASAGLSIITVPQIPDLSAISKDITISRSTFNRNVGGFIGIGMNIISTDPTLLSQNVTATDCVAYGNSVTAPLGFLATGMAFVANQIVAKNCVGSDSLNSSVGVLAGHATGLSFFGNNILAEDCVAAHIRANSTGVFGFYCTSLQNDATYRRCVAYDVRNDDTALGFGWSYGFANVQFEFGFTLNLGRGVIFDGCIAENCTAALGLGAGLALMSQRNPTVQNCIFNRNDIGIYAIDFTFLGAPVSTNGIIANNILQDNTSFGIADFTAPPANHAYYGNRARSNGVNYFGLGAGTPIRNWALPGLPATTDNNGIIDPLDNINITP